MSIVFGASGAVAAGTTTLAVPHPAGLTAGDFLVLCVANKYPGAAPSTPAGWRLAGTASGGAGAAGIDTGQAVSSILTKVAVGNETGNLSVTTGGNVSLGRMFRYRSTLGKSIGTIVDRAQAGRNANGGTPGARYGTSSFARRERFDSYWTGSTGVGILSVAINSDLYTYGPHTASFGGIANRTGNELQDSGSAGGQDGALLVVEYTIPPSATGLSAAWGSSSGTSANSPAGAMVMLVMYELDYTPYDPMGMFGIFGY